jgi:hypothetical protein
MMFDSTLILIAAVFALAGFVKGMIGNAGRDGLRDIGAFAFFDPEAHMGCSQTGMSKNRDAAILPASFRHRTADS